MPLTRAPRGLLDRSGGWPILIGTGFVLAVGVAGLYTVDSSAGSPGCVAFILFAVACLVTVTVAPLLRGARPRRLWLVQATGGGLLLGTLLVRLLGLAAGQLDAVDDILYLGGFGCFVTWLVLMNRYVGGAGDATVVLDVAATTTGAVLTAWIAVLVPLSSETGLPAGGLWATYPTIDVAMLALAFHLSFRLPVVVPALRGLIAVILLMLVIDTATSFTLLFHGSMPPALFAAYALPYYGLAMTALHPSIVELTPHPAQLEQPRRSRRATAVTVLTLSPAVLATAVPTESAADIVVRTTLVGALLVLLFTRLSGTMRALSSAEEASRYRATHDELTGLLNRHGLLEYLGHLLHRDAIQHSTTAVLFLDCDDFKHVNDTWGHRAGDALLRDIADRLPRHLGEDVVLARHGGDEFVLVASVDAEEDAVRIAERVRAFFDQPLRPLPHRSHTLAASVGIALAGPGDRVTPEYLLTGADHAMYHAKRIGHGTHVVLDDALMNQTQLRSKVGDRLGAAIERGDLHVDLQPIMSGQGYRHLVGWEALARWHDPVLGDVSPTVFVPVAEQLGLIDSLGALVLRLACRDLARLRATPGAGDLIVSVNVSPAQLLHPGFTAMVRDALAAADLAPTCLWLEITETLLVEDGPDLLSTLAALRDTGVRIAIDDFGSGYASLATLLRLPIDVVKLDRSLTTRLSEHGDARQVDAVIALVNSLGIDRSVAEGVETQEQAETLQELGCTMVQGWRYGRPAPVGALLAEAAHPTGAERSARADPEPHGPRPNASRHVGGAPRR